MTKGKGKNPGAGNLDKHIKREAHKERPQLNKRKHLGSLEKHKDYKLRSQRRHKKENKLFQIKRAIAQKNPDEFNCKMTKLYIDNDSGYIKKRYDKNNKKKEILAEIEENNNNNIYLKHKARMDSNRAKELLNEVTGIQTSTILINNNINNINNNNNILQYIINEATNIMISFIISVAQASVSEAIYIHYRQLNNNNNNN
eukprot:Tbor_TRINITY_DN5336_c6_g3::TRINITY_DN5336_c6_g3_i1::g.5190::m.5190/K14769/UTP11; U3 small nucleolar RNA-associated protein 11